MKSNTKIYILPGEDYYELTLSDGQPFLHLINVTVYLEENQDIRFGVDPKYQLISVDPNGDKGNRIQINFAELNLSDELVVKTKIYNHVDIEQLESIIINVNREADELKNAKIEIELSTLDYVRNKSMELQFLNHLYIPRNNKILFSAPFGSGKTTFLDYFFEENSSNYEVFKVFPVNYSVASNEDIFKYIKTDILFQLLGKGVKFEKENFSNSLKAEQFIFSNLGQVITTLIKTGLSLSSETKSMIRAIDELKGLISSFETFKNEAEIDEEKETIDYIKEVYEQEGSIFEDNFFTQLIRNLIDQIKLKEKKQTVLVIDDLDRMDPDHIFRILNVISAHCDDYSLRGEKYYNKFGFDKIIVVCDINNIEEIFKHRYGAKVDFNGYINKFYSSKVFEFSGKFVSIQFFENIFDFHSKHPEQSSLNLLKILVETDFVYLRDIIKTFRNVDLESLHSDIDELTDLGFNSSFVENLFSSLLIELVKVYGSENLIEHFYKERHSSTVDEFYQVFTPFLLAASANTNVDNGIVSFHNNTKLKFERLDNHRGIPYAAQIKISSPQFGSFQPYQVKKSDFYKLIIKNIELINKHIKSNN